MSIKAPWIDTIECYVNDISKVLKFYVNNPIGLEVKELFEDKAWKTIVARIPLGNSMMLEFIQPTDPESDVAKRIQMRGEGIDHITLRVANFNEVITKMRKNKTPIVDFQTGQLLEEPMQGIEGATVGKIDEKATKIAIHLHAFECVKCGHQLEKSMNYCSNCGTKIEKKMASLFPLEIHNL